MGGWTPATDGRCNSLQASNANSDCHQGENGNMKGGAQYRSRGRQRRISASRQCTLELGIIKTRKHQVINRQAIRFTLYFEIVSSSGANCRTVCAHRGTGRYPFRRFFAVGNRAYRRRKS